MKQKNYRRAATWLITALLLCLTACASIPAPKKVQTYEELFLKLKEGFYSGRLMEEEFYAKELGYSLRAPLRFLPNSVQDLDREQRIVLDESGFHSDWLIVVSELNEKNQKTVRIRFQKNTSTCLSESVIKNFWGEGNLKPDRRESLSHLRLQTGVVYVPPIQWQSDHKTKAQSMDAGFQFSGATKCLGQAGFLISNTKE